ncbi:ATP-binding protein [Streptomonospora nanhaiensis]|uniref:ATP-binding protein n=1 Tax=Streptomonospora nanhaiensis TaxID=1323731 RepID=UPI001C387CDD|nr:ATP-binding protein [Streptomonospora nanhaiensis]MBV2364494.1 ATP-binding protein [Streptomonospora nanhaiensis]
MSDPDENTEGAKGTAPNPDSAGTGTHRHVHVEGDAGGAVVAGDYNVLIDAHHGSWVTVTQESRRPRPRRRGRASVLPRRQAPPLGRESEIAALAELVTVGGTVQVYGPPGIGKSTLLRHAATALEPGPDGVVFVSAAHRHVADVAQEIFEACYDARGYAPSWARLRTLMADVRVTVYVDDADLDADRLRELTDAAPAATFVLAGREASLLGEAAVISVEGLGRPAAARLLSRALDRPLWDHERSVADDLWLATGGSPLLLLRAAGLARTARAALPPPGAVPDVLPLLLGRRDAAETRVLTLLATLGDAGLAPAHVQALTGEADADALCRRLADLGLAVATPEGFRAAPDVGAALRDRRVAPFPVEPLCHHFARWAADPATPADQVAAHGRVFERLADLARAAGQPELAVLIGRAAAPRTAQALRFDAWGRLLGRGWHAADEAGDHRAKAYFTHEEGVRCLVSGRRVAAAALLAEAAVLWHVWGDEQSLTAVGQAQDLLPPAPHPAAGPAGAGGVEPSAAPGGETPQPVADHMADLAPEPAGADPFAPGPGAQGPPDAGAAGAGGQPPGADAHGQPPPADTGGAGAPAAPEHAFPSADSTSAVFSDGGVSAASGAAGTATTGGGAAGGTGAATTAAGAAAGGTAASSVLTTVLVGLVIAGAGLVVREVVISQDTAEEAGAGATAETADGTDTHAPDDTADYEPPPLDTGTDDYALQEPPEPTGVAGTWQDDRGYAATIWETGPGQYAMAAPCGEPDIVLTGSDTQVTGEEPVMDSSGGSCGPVIGYTSLTITVAPGGDSAEFTSTMPTVYGDDGTTWECSNCGTFTYYRVE